MKIAVFGMGYVGMILSACLAKFEHQIIGVDISEDRINKLSSGKSPIFEPRLPELISQGVKNKNLQFTADSKKAISFAETIFITVGTPSKSDGSVDLKYVEEVARTIGKNIKSYKIIAIKSTVPAGTAKKVEEIIKKEYQGEFDIISTPEFLREGSAVLDFLKPDRVVIGAKNKKSSAAKQIEQLFNFCKCTILLTDNASAEMIKYASNAFLANQISYINMVSNICEKFNADVETVALGMKLDKRIGLRAYLGAGIGYGGSCFTKDVQAFLATARQTKAEHSLLDDIEKINKAQRHLVIKKARKEIKDLANKKIAIWGLAFKPNSDDLRDAPSIDIIKDFIKAKSEVHAYDPEVDEEYKEQFPGVVFESDPISCIEKADCLVIATDWKIFQSLDMAKVKELMKNPFIIDGRNMFNKESITNLGFTYVGFGR